MACLGAGLGNVAGVGITGLAERWVHDVVTRAVGGTPGVFVAHIGERRVGQIVLFTWFNSGQKS